MIIPLILLAFPLFQARTRTLQRTQSIWKQTCWRANYGGRYSAEATLSRGCNDLTQDDMYVAFDFSSSVVSRFLICCAFSVFVFFMWYCGIIFLCHHSSSRQGRRHYVFGLSVHLCVRYLCMYVHVCPGGGILWLAGHQLPVSSVVHFFLFYSCSTVFSVLWHCWLGVMKSIRPVKIEWWGIGVVICL